MKYLRHKKIKGYDNIDAIFDSRILKVLDIMFGTDLNQAHEATQRRLKMHRDLKEHAEDGKVALMYSGRDCDCMEYSSHYSIADATAKGIDEEVEHILQSLDGPLYSMWIEKPSVALNSKPTSRDLAMEAFEDGHPHIVYSSQ